MRKAKGAPRKERILSDFTVLFEDGDLMIVDKTSSIPVQKDKSGDLDLQSAIRAAVPSCGKFLEAAHRIDRRTSGIVVFAKNQFSLRAMDKAFRLRNVEKAYVACVEKEPVPPEGILEHRIAHDGRKNISVALPLEAPQGGIDSGKESLPSAKLSYRLILKTDRYFFVEVRPDTGRTHQIRAQFAAMGWPIKGDLKYGSRRGTLTGRIMLHAWKISFPHPRTGAALSFEAPFPDDETLWKVLSSSMAQEQGNPA